MGELENSSSPAPGVQGSTREGYRQGHEVAQCTEHARLGHLNSHRALLPVLQL